MYAHERRNLLTPLVFVACPLLQRTHALLAELRARSHPRTQAAVPPGESTTRLVSNSAQQDLARGMLRLLSQTSSRVSLVDDMYSSVSRHQPSRLLPCENNERRNETPVKFRTNTVQDKPEGQLRHLLGDFSVAIHAPTRYHKSTNALPLLASSYHAHKWLVTVSSCAILELYAIEINSNGDRTSTHLLVASDAR